MERSTMPEPYQNSIEGFRERLGYIRKNTLYSDCQFRVRDKLFNVHKMLLASSSPVFEAMFYGSLSVAAAQPITIEDIDPEIFELLLCYIYEGQLKFPSVDVAKDVLSAAHKYMIDFLQDKCADYLTDNLDNKNCLGIYELATFFGDTDLQTSSLKYIQENTSAVLKYCDYEALLINTLLTILSQQQLSIRSESELLRALERYAISHEVFKEVNKSSPEKNSDKKDEEELKVQLALKSIRFLTMSVNDFIACAATSKLLTAEEKFLILSTLAYRGNSNKPFLYPEKFSRNTTRRREH